MKLSELFEKEIGYIENKHLANIVKDTLDASPECIKTIPASSSGKYHPSYSLGNGGLVRHIKAAVGIARSLCETKNFEYITIGHNSLVSEHVHMFKDIAYAALILHDCMKSDDGNKHRTLFDHPLRAAELFVENSKKHITDENIEYMETVISLTYSCIASHMGEWNTAPYAKGVILPKPKSGLETFVHMCDYLASRKFLIFDFDLYESTCK